MQSQKRSAWTNLLVTLTLAAVSIGCIVFGDASGQQPEAKAQEFREPFKGQPNERVKLWGPDAAKFVKFEAEGFRVTLPAGHAGERPTGINTDLAVHGDFEISVQYEIFQEPPPKAHDTASMKLILMAVLDRKQLNPVVLARIQTGEGEPKFSTYATITDKETGQKKTKGAKQFPASTKSGRLRMMRKDAVISVYVLEEPEKEFRFLKEFPFPIGDNIKFVRVMATTGGEKASLDVRFSDLQIRWGTLDGVAMQPVPAAGDDGALPAGTRGWLPAVVLIGVVLILFLGLGLGLLLYARSRSAAVRK